MKKSRENERNSFGEIENNFPAHRLHQLLASAYKEHKNLSGWITSSAFAFQLPQDETVKHMKAAICGSQSRLVNFVFHYI